MNIKNFTDDAQKILLHSQQCAKKTRTQHVEPEHLLYSLVQDNTVKSVLSKHATIIQDILEQLERDLSNFNAGKSDALSPRYQKIVSAAEALATSSGEKANTLHLLDVFCNPELANFGGARIIQEHGFTPEKIKEAGRQPPMIKRRKRPDDKASALYKYTIDLVERARNGEIGPVVGRDDEMRRALQVLSRKVKNNPVFIGSPGIGKSAIIEGIAIRIASGDVPSSLANKRILSLDLGAILAGATLRGQFEERLKSVVNEVIQSAGEIILFVEEIHSMVGAGGEGASNASNLLKPSLARGEIQVIGSTTTDEYRNTIEKDKALERRFQSIQVAEPTADEAISIIRGIKDKFEVHHGVRITDPAIVSAVKLSKRYVASRHLPDKAIDLVDEAASRLKIQIDSVPSELDTVERKLSQMRMELRALNKEEDADSAERKQVLTTKIGSLEKQEAELRDQWEQELAFVQKVQALKEEMSKIERQLTIAERNNQMDEASDLKYGPLKRLQEELDKTTTELATLQSNKKMIKEEVGPEDIAEVIGAATGIPVSNMLEDEKDKLLKMEERLGKQVIGQKESLGALAKSIRRSRAGLNDPNRPVGSFFFLGPTGVGKTLLAKSLTEFLFEDPNNMIRLDMSEFMEKHAVARLIGAPPGYVGSDEGGQLTEAVRRHPYSVILFDEVEKAHPDVFNLLLQILDDGRLTDSQSNLVDFKNTVIIMTSNVGSHHLMDGVDEDGKLKDEAKEKAVEELRNNFRPEFLGRIDEVITFHGLTRQNIDEIAEIEFKKILKSLQDKKMSLVFEDAAKRFVIEDGFDPRYGARPLRRAIQKQLLDPLAEELLRGKFVEGDSIKVKLVDGSLSFEV